MEIDPKLLRYLLAISRAGSFGRAAEMLNISQPALSVAISRLEDVLGATIVDRGRHGAQLNATGEILIRHATSLEHVLATAGEEIELYLGGIAGPLSIGGTPLSMVSIIPEVLAALSREFGNISATVVERSDEDLMAMLERHELDIAISNIGLREQPQSIEGMALFSARTVAVVRAGHVLAARSSVSLKELAGCPWALPPKGGAFRQVIEALFTTHGIVFPKSVIEADQFGTLKRIVRDTDLVTLLSDQIVRPELENGSLIAIPLVEMATPRRFGVHVLRERKLNVLARRFIAYAQELAPKYEIQS